MAINCLAKATTNAQHFGKNYISESSNEVTMQDAKM